MHSEFIAAPRHRDKADKGSDVSAGAIAGSVSAAVALLAVGAAIHMRRRRMLQASESAEVTADVNMHQNPGIEAADDDAVPAVADSVNAM